MKTNKLKFLVIVFTIIMLISTISLATDTTPVTTAEDTVDTTTDDVTATTTNETTPATQQTHEGDLYLFGDEIVMDKLVDGNVYLFGNDVKITGKINGNLFVFANKLFIEKGSYAINSIYAFVAEEFDMYGASTDLYLFANKANIRYDAFAKRDMHIIASTLNFQGAVGRDVSVSCENFNLVSGDEGAEIYGNLNYQSSQEIEIPEGVVEGEISFKQMESETQEVSISQIVIKYLYNLVETLAFTALAYLFIKWATPKFAKEAGNYISPKNTTLAWLVGLATVVVLALASILMIFSYILIPVSIASITALVLLCCLSTTIVVMTIVQRINNKLGDKASAIKTILLFLLVTIIIWGLQQLPKVGVFISVLFVMPFGVGVPVYRLFTRQKIKKDKATEVIQDK